MRPCWAMSVAVAIVAIGAAVMGTTLGARAQNADPICEAFARNADGSWSATRNYPLNRAGRRLNIQQGAVFKPGAAFLGIELASELEQACPQIVQQQAELAKQVGLATYADASGNIDVQKLSCAQLTSTYPEEAELLLVWSSGWHHGLAKRSTFNAAKAKDGARDILGYCKANTDKRVGQAIDAVLKSARP